MGAATGFPSGEDVALMRAVLADDCASDEAARKYLNAARALGVDPLDYCAHRFGLGNATVWQRAAEWAGFQFAVATPSKPASAVPRIDRLDRLGELRSFRQEVLGEEMIFIAPGFVVVVALAEARHRDPSMLPRVRFVPPEAIESGVARAADAQLMDEARQRITLRWPRASAAVDLPLGRRLGFVAVLALLVSLVMAAGLIARPVLVPLVALLLIAPGVLRLLAAFPGPRGRPVPTLLSDAELPVYSVLIPLRDEARMVPLLQRAMSALDYPALGSKLKWRSG